ncbi:hypothetical protein GQ473_01105 [archaeon]|nr:hypothetical protein [archaeon]
MARKTKTTIFKFAPPFYIILIAIAIIGLAYMMLTGVPTNNIGLIAVSLIFGFLLIMGLLVSSNRFKVMEETLSESAQGFTLLFLIWFALLQLKNISSYFNIFSFPTQSTLATIQESIPPFWGMINTVFMAPTNEEIFWFALAILIFGVMNKIGKEIKIFKNLILQFIVVLVIGMVTFASFHTSQESLMFYLSAMIFRGLMIVLLFGDKKYDLIPKFTMTLSGLIGAHMANNIVAYGFMNTFNMLMTNMFGMILIVIFASIFAYGIRGLLFGKR